MHQAFNKRKAHNDAAEKTRKRVRQEEEQIKALDIPVVSLLSF